jgi:hypothetical protein
MLERPTGMTYLDREGCRLAIAQAVPLRDAPGSSPDRAFWNCGAP